jgi:hypothetical protein
MRIRHHGLSSERRMEITSAEPCVAVGTALPPRLPAARGGAPESRSGGRPGLSAALVGTAAQAELGVREAEHGRRARTRSPIQHQKHSDADRIPRRSRVRAACWM